jgi:signal transduction histidine kinase/CheY-like chemotaxis protein
MSASIRVRLLLLVLSVMLPSLIGLAWLVVATFQAERAGNERALREVTQALSLAVDGEFDRRDTIARVLAQSRWLDGGGAATPEDLQRFAQLARRALGGVDGWVEVWDRERLLLDTRGPARADAPPLFEQAPRQPVARDAGTEPNALVVEPVVREGRTVLNVGVSLLPQELQRLIDRQALPPDWIGTVMDHRGRVVARHPGGSAFIGRAAGQNLLEQISAAPQGTFQSVSLDGRRVSGYYSTSTRGWTYLSAMQRPALAELLPLAVLQVVLGALVLATLAVLAARHVSRGIVKPVLALKDAAQRMQAGQPVETRGTGIAECDEVAQALAEASESIRNHQAELEHQVAGAVAQTRLAEQRISQSQWIDALGRLTGGVAHEFNNLLGVISNCTHLIEQHPAAAELRAPLAATRRSVEAGSQLTQHLLRFAGRRPLRPQRLELGRRLPEIQEVLRSVLGRRIEVSVTVAPGTEAVKVDPGEFELAIINLALNARDAMPDGGELRLAARNAEPAELEDLPAAVATAGRPYVLVTASDDGAGIEPELLPRVFEPFFTTKAMGRGTGLGLSQVQSFCVQAGGSARLDSTVGIGTTVSLLLPAAAAEAGDTAALPAPATARVRRLDGARVLLVDDNDELARTVSSLLQAHGARVRHAADADEALRLIEAEPAFDVVLSDVTMPGTMDGLALARLLRQRQPPLPVVLISGYGAVAADFTVLRKPCSEQEMIAALCGEMMARATAR